MIVGSFNLQAAMAQQQDAASLPWQEEHSEWQHTEHMYREQLERHYFAQQEVEYNARLTEYYAARQQHQQEQHRLNQVLYGFGPSQRALPPSQQPSQQQYHPQPQLQQYHPQQQYHQQRSLPQPQGMGGMDCCMQQAASPRLPLAAVCPNFGMAAVGGGMAWELVGQQGIALGRKRGHDAAMGEPDSGPDSAFKRRAFQRN